VKAVLAAVAVLLCAPIAAPAATFNTEASDLVTMIAGREVATYCGDSQAEWDAIPAVKAQPWAVAGFTYLGMDTVYLSPDTCTALVSVSRNAGGAALTITHEAIHAGLNTADEGLTECLAGLNVWRVVHALQLPRKVEKQAYAEAMREHRIMATVPGYDWHGRC
jgi:hypothetical protein